jgi:hypothetical protein
MSTIVKFSHAGVSKQDGEFKVRFCNDALRTKVLKKNGHTDIDIVELKHPMTKAETVAYLLSIDFDNGNKAVRAALEAAGEKRGVIAKPKAEKKAKAKTPAAPIEAPVGVALAASTELEAAPL